MNIPSKARHIRIPAFLPVPLRARADGWTPLRQAMFLVALARTGSVSAAAREAGLSRVSAYQLRRRPGAGSFAAVWDMVLGQGTRPQWKFTAQDRFRAVTEGLVKPQVWQGRCVGIARKFSGAALIGLIARLARKRRKRTRGPAFAQGFDGDRVWCRSPDNQPRPPILASAAMTTWLCSPPDCGTISPVRSMIWSHTAAMPSGVRSSAGRATPGVRVM